MHVLFDIEEKEKQQVPIGSRGGCERGQRELLVGCRDGLVLIDNTLRCNCLVWEPFTGEHRCMAFPPELDEMHIVAQNGAVFRAAGDDPRGRFPLQAVLVGTNWQQAFGCVYWSLSRIRGGILEFDLKRQRLAVVDVPMDILIKGIIL
ncbi:hypothetical protein E2562_025542 [Oryza meyeriana var. granulata]|uniref:Uncharacterized protein n=1 Tax=Oryza meyeriana var. granulata TaxID=110450 RepID=A0A6G1FCB3_9ORYZ|nr:hypothetical protein E2562_025542 [Oryza meyeriana var. granulata]